MSIGQRSIISSSERDHPNMEGPTHQIHRPRPAASKILSETELVEVLRGEREERKIVFTNGCFDLFHAGHASLLEQARALGDLLVVGVNSDGSLQGLKGEGRPLQGSHDRMMVVAAVEAVDFVVEFTDPTPTRLIEQLKPDVHVKGGDYRADELPEAPLVRSYGGEVKIIPMVTGVSTTRLIDRIKGGSGPGEEPEPAT